MGRRPICSDKGAHSKGPRANPQTIIEQVRTATSKETSYFSSIKPRPPVTIEDPKAIATTSIDTIIVQIHLYNLDQFLGFSGSFSVKVTYSVESFSESISFSNSDSSFEY